ncbi:hypothetical protein M501DRAFT_1051112 [Patellaria atrata CBS 101060]|uniref:Cenp-O kinetochore centromere component n=1 Tax=Patellaria atrata CBS 101060 TaxID=1346257 RepID=A0A9P4VPR7_9PEZI|nr:hypothetical protein M501DRAFT_1051112 [Patellaria atrata CBS 101060]
MDDTNLPSDLDAEISTLRSQIQHLKTRRAVLTTALLSSHHTLHRLERAASNPRLRTHKTPIESALALTRAQRKHNEQTTHRLCAGATAFAVRDPDPRAADGGRVLGVRIEVPVRDQLLPAYYVLLKREGDGDGVRVRMRVCKHTVPACVSVEGLAARYLPGEGKRQDLGMFVKRLRREIVGWHCRIMAVEGLRGEVGLEKGGDVHTDGGIVDVGVTDLSVRELRMEWVDGTRARIRISAHGCVERVVVSVGEGGDRSTAGELRRRIEGGDGRIEGIVKRILA